jgi:hypothetical protein
MLDIYLFEPDIVHQAAIREICTQYSVKHNTDSAFKATEVIPEKINRDEGYGEETSLYMIKGDEHIESLAVSIYEINNSNYTVLIADGLQDILACISSSFKPSGILMKPAEYEAAEKILNDIYADFKRSGAVSGQQFRFKIRSREYSVDVNSILYFEAANKKMILRTAGQAFEFYMSAEDVISRLPEGFARIHKSYIVNTKHITVADFKNMTVTLNDGSVIFVSRTYKSNLQEAMKQNGGN